MSDKHNNEDGAALVTALLVLAVLTMLGMAAILTSTTDLKISGNEKASIQGQYAAEAGMARMLVLLNNTTMSNFEPNPAPVWVSNNPNWVRSIKGNIMDGTKVFFTYSAIVRYKPIQSGTYAGKVAFYNRSSGYAPPAPSTGGWPVYVIESVGRLGSFQTPKSILEVTKSSFNFKVKGGVTAGTGLDLSGSFKIDPNFYDTEGNALSPQPVGSDPNCKNSSLASPKPGVYANGTSTGNVTDLGNKGIITSANGELAQNPAGTDIPRTPWEAMGINKNAGEIEITPDTGVYFDDIFPDGPATYTSGAPKGNNWYGSDADALDGDGEGLLIVHNPRFDLKNNCPTCGGNCSNVPANNPCRAAVLSKGGGNSTFKGLVIADAVYFQGAGNIEITGGLISLTTFDTSNWNGNGTIEYSCQAIEEFAGGKINRKLNWHKE